MSNDSKHKFKQLLLREMKLLKVVFMGYEAVESGGPMKGFFAICDSNHRKRC